MAVSSGSAEAHEIEQPTWIAVLPSALISAAAFFLLVQRQPFIGWGLLAAGLLGAWMCDRVQRSAGLLKDLFPIVVSLLILSSIDLKADLSNEGVLRFVLGLGGALLVPYLWFRFVVGNSPIKFPWGTWRWNRAQWIYLSVVVVAGYLLLPWYFITSGVYLNWPNVHDPSGVARLFIGVNLVGIWDELFFICSVFAIHRRHHRVWVANILQAAIFVSFLWELGYQSWGPILTIPFALVQGAIFNMTKNLKYVITVHLLFDVVVFLVLIHAHNPSWPHIFFLFS